MSTVRERLIHRLREISQPTFEPSAPEDRGICDEVDFAFQFESDEQDEAYQTLIKAFRVLKPGCKKDNPLGDFWEEGSLWAGERGDRRRAFAAEIADWLERNP
jgi:hypothetical protein